MTTTPDTSRPLHELSPSQLADLFIPSPEPPPWAAEGGEWAPPVPARPAAAAPSLHDLNQSQLGELAWSLQPADDDAPAPPGDGLEPAPVPAADDRKRLPEAPATTLDGLLGGLEARLAPAAVTLPPAAELVRSFRNLPGDQRGPLALRMLAEDFGLDATAASEYGDDYRTRLAADALAQRYGDAVRVEPDLAPGDFMARMLPKPEPKPETVNDNPFA
jgi:hypothetical protein